MKTDFAQSIEDLNLTEALRKCAACAAVVVEREKIFLITPDAESLLGVSSEELIGQPVSALPEPLAKAFEQTLGTGQSFAGQIGLPKNPDGETSLQINLSAILGKRGKLSGAIAVLHDFSCAEPLAK